MKENLDGMDAKLGMMNVTKSVNQPRKSGFELLRIVAVVLIVAHHLVCHSGYPLFAEPLSVRRLFYRGASFKNEREIRSGASPVLSVNS